jgi:hypothetical protein
MTDGMLYRLETKSGEVYRTKQLTRDETGFQIVIRKRVGGARGRQWEELEPIHVAFENVESLESIDPRTGRTFLLVLGIVVVVVGGAIGIAWIIDPPGIGSAEDWRRAH